MDFANGKIQKPSTYSSMFTSTLNYVGDYVGDPDLPQIVFLYVVIFLVENVFIFSEDPDLTRIPLRKCHSAGLNSFSCNLRSSLRRILVVTTGELRLLQRKDDIRTGVRRRVT